MSTTVRRMLCLETVARERPVEVRRRVCELVREVAEADAVGFFRVAIADGTYVYSDWATDGDAALCGQFEGTAGRPFETLKSWNPSDPPAGEVGRFVTMRQSRSLRFLEQLEAWHRYYVPLGIGDQVRVLMYQGGRLLGWFGAFRYEDGRPFSRRTVRRLDSLASAVEDTVAAADSELLLGDDGPASLLVRPNGGVDFATPAAQQWMEVYGSGWIADVVRHAERGDEADGVPLHMAWVRWVRMEPCAGEGSRYLLTVEPGDLPSVSPLSVLPARRRAVAEYAAAGATAREIAETLGVSVETVRTQLKAVYAALGVACRAELATLVSSDRPRCG